MRSSYMPAVLPAIVAIATFAADTFAPKNLDIAILYVVAVALSLRTSRNGIAFTTAMCCMLTVIGAFVPVPNAFPVVSEPFVNRILTVCAIMTTGILANTISTAVRASKEDQLTQVYNRRGMEAELAARSAKPSVAILIDIDDFKKINDTWGLLVGDTVLREVAEMLTTVARTSDLICRYGGDEFLILLSDCPLPQARKIAERIYRLLSNARIEVNHDGAYVRITASLGVSPLDAATTIAEAVRKTQGALKESKRAGKNCVTYLVSTDGGTELIATNPGSDDESTKKVLLATPPSQS